MVYDPTQSSGQGTTDMPQGALGMPFLAIIQKGSPEFDETHQNHATKKIVGCRPGNIVFAPERKVVAQPLEVLPLATTAMYTRWAPRTSGGGFVGNCPLSIVGDAQYRKGAPGTSSQYKEYLGQDELIYTIYVLLQFQDNNDWKKGMVGFTSTQLRAARAWLQMIKGIKYPSHPNVVPPIFASTYSLATKIDSNAKGSWYAWEVKPGRILDFVEDEELLSAAEAQSKEAVLSLPKPSGDQQQLV